MFHCCAISCVRQLTGPKTYVNYLIEETCRHVENGDCTYKRHEKIERKDYGKPESTGK